MENLKISILTVCYNAASTIKATINSVAIQKYSNIEYIIVDGNSKDGTISIIKKHRDKITTFVSECDKGIYDAINKGLKLATGDFLLVLGADDCLRDENVIGNVASYIKDKESVYYGDIYRNVRKDFYCGKFNSFKLAVKNISHQALFYPKSVYKSQDYEVRYRLFADWAYNLHLWKNCSFKYIPIIVTNYNDEGSSNSQKDDCFFRDYKMLVCDNIGKLQYYYAEAYHFLRNLIKKDKIRTR